MLVRLQSEDVKEVVVYASLRLSSEVKAGDRNSEIIGIKFMMVRKAAHRIFTWSSDDGLYLLILSTNCLKFHRYSITICLLL